MTDLKTAIESLYEVFSRYPRPATVEICPCCTKPEAVSHLTVAPLRELRFEDMADYSCSAMSTQGSVDDWKWLLQIDTLQRIANSAYLLRNDGFEHLFERIEKFAE